MRCSLYIVLVVKWKKGAVWYPMTTLSFFAVDLFSSYPLFLEVFDFNSAILYFVILSFFLSFFLFLTLSYFFRSVLSLLSSFFIPFFFHFFLFSFFFQIFFSFSPHFLQPFSFFFLSFFLSFTKYSAFSFINSFISFTKINFLCIFILSNSATHLHAIYFSWYIFSFSLRLNQNFSMVTESFLFYFFYLVSFFVGVLFTLNNWRIFIH